jgi:uncharacterized protein
METEALDQLLASDAATRLIAFRDTVVQALPGAVRDVVLFGSRARGDASQDSDYDVAVLLANNVAADRNVRRRLADAAWEHVIDGYAIVPIALEADALARDRPTRTELGARIAMEGISI